MSLRSSITRFHSRVAPGGIAAGRQEKFKERKHERSVDAQLNLINRANKKINFFPAGFNKSQFFLKPSKDGLTSDPASKARRRALLSRTSGLKDAISDGDIFAYNRRVSGLRKTLSKIDGGKKMPKRMPDAGEIRRLARIRQQRSAPGSRAQTLNLGLV
jgi:hypothetical protein